MANQEIGILGAGSFGTALGHLLATKGFRVTQWARDTEIARVMNSEHRNPKYLTDVRLPDLQTGTADIARAVQGKDLILSVIPSQAARSVLKGIAPSIGQNAIIVSASKGIENGTLMTMNEVFKEVLPAKQHRQLAFLSGPSFAREVATGQPTAATLAAEDESVAKQAQEAFATPYFRTYFTTDVIGVEIGGACKNVIAIAAGISDGLGLGTNARAALITRGLAEIARLGVAKGADPLTFSGLAGMGDLVLTCTGDLSRNRRVGLGLGRGEKLAAILDGMDEVAEGVKTAQSVHELAAKCGVEMPISDTVYRVLFEDLSAKKALAGLMTRDLKHEQA